MRERFLGALSGRCAWVFGHRDGLRVHRGQQLQGEAEAVLAFVHPVDEHLDVDRFTLGFKPTGEFFVGESSPFTQVLDKSLGLHRVEVARVHWQRSHMVLGLSTSYAEELFFDHDKSFYVYWGLGRPIRPY